MKSSMKSSMNLGSQSGQIVVEYVLLLVIAVSMSALIVRQLGSRDEQNPGVLVQKWHNIQIEIGKDLPDQCTGAGCNQ